MCSNSTCTAIQKKVLMQFRKLKKKLIIREDASYTIINSSPTGIDIAYYSSKLKLKAVATFSQQKVKGM